MEVNVRKNITFRAEEYLIKRAREKAARQNKSINSVFREWLSRYVGADDAHEGYERLMARLGHARSGRKFTREEMNER